MRAEERKNKLDEKRLHKYILSSRKSYEELLKGFVEIPTISSDPACKKEIERAAALAAGTLRKSGLKTEIVKTPGHPLVIASAAGNKDNPTVLIYNHLDVQPADRSEWDRDPFTLTTRHGRYGGRGAADDKGPALTALLAVQYAREEGIPLNFRFVGEFEEEVGSPHFEKAVCSKKELLRSDSVLVSDTVWISAKRPAIPYGIRGLLTATLHLETASREAHSGLAGGAARNPIGELCEVIHKCHDPSTGRVKVPGFYDDVLKGSRKELQGFLESGFKISGFKKAHGLKSIRFGEAAQVLKAVWSQPTFEVHGIRGGYTGEGVKTIVPPRAEAKISMRLVPNQDPRKIFSLFKSFIKECSPDVKVKCDALLTPYLASPEGEHLQAAQDAMHLGFKKRPALIREGGSIGAVVSLYKLLKVPVIFLGLALPEHGYHAPNEYFEWRQVKGGVRTFVHYFDRISRIR